MITQTYENKSMYSATPRTIGHNNRCASDSDCRYAYEYCNSRKVCVNFRSDYCNRNSCGLGDAGACSCIFDVWVPPMLLLVVWGVLATRLYSCVFAKSKSSLAKTLNQYLVLLHFPHRTRTQSRTSSCRLRPGRHRGVRVRTSLRRE